MCSFLILSWVLQNISVINTYLKSRGPDATYVYRRNIDPGGKRWNLGQSFPFRDDFDSSSVNVAASESSSALLLDSSALLGTTTDAVSEDAKSLNAPGELPLKNPPLHLDLLFNHLHMTGSETPQPFRSKDGYYVATFNGEIYNWADLAKEENLIIRSDGDVIIPMYLKYGPKFVQRLDGEYAIVLLDLKLMQFVIGTDVFGTKPLWLSIFKKKDVHDVKNGRTNIQFAISSYRSGIARSGAPAHSIRIVDPNTVAVLKVEMFDRDPSKSEKEKVELDRTNLDQIHTAFKINQGVDNKYLNIVFDDTDKDADKDTDNEKSKRSTKGLNGGNGLNDFSGASTSIKSIKIIDKFPVYEFDLRQHKTHVYDVIKAFERSIEKRVKTSLHPPFIGLSSGYDAGAVHLALTKGNYPHYYYTIMGVECMETIKNRNEYSKEVAKAIIIDYSYDMFQRVRSYLQACAEPWEFSEFSRGTTGRVSVVDDDASMGLAQIMGVARTMGTLVYLTGSGGDEILSDYGFNGTAIYSQSTINGTYPENLSEIFPTQIFFLGTMRDYIMKEELVGGAFGIEARYPFLDREFVQEYLWVKSGVKNQEYKNVLDVFFRENNYPYKKRDKTGFSSAENRVISPYSLVYEMSDFFKLGEDATPIYNGAMENLKIKEETIPALITLKKHRDVFQNRQQNRFLAEQGGFLKKYFGFKSEADVSSFRKGDSSNLVTTTGDGSVEIGTGDDLRVVKLDFFSKVEKIGYFTPTVYIEYNSDRCWKDSTGYSIVHITDNFEEENSTIEDADNSTITPAVYSSKGDLNTADFYAGNEEFSILMDDETPQNPELDSNKDQPNENIYATNYTHMSDDFQDIGGTSRGVNAVLKEDSSSESAAQQLISTQWVNPSPLQAKHFFKDFSYWVRRFYLDFVDHPQIEILNSVAPYADFNLFYGSTSTQEFNENLRILVIGTEKVESDFQKEKDEFIKRQKERFEEFQRDKTEKEARGESVPEWEHELPPHRIRRIHINVPAGQTKAERVISHLGKAYQLQTLELEFEPRDLNEAAKRGEGQTGVEESEQKHNLSIKDGGWNFIHGLTKLDIVRYFLCYTSSTWASYLALRKTGSFADLNHYWEQSVKTIIQTGLKVLLTKGSHECPFRTEFTTQSPHTSVDELLGAGPQLNDPQNLVFYGILKVKSGLYDKFQQEVAGNDPNLGWEGVFENQNFATNMKKTGMHHLLMLYAVFMTCFFPSGNRDNEQNSQNHQSFSKISSLKPIIMNNHEHYVRKKDRKTKKKKGKEKEGVIGKDGGGIGNSSEWTGNPFDNEEKDPHKPGYWTRELGFDNFSYNTNNNRVLLMYIDADRTNFHKGGCFARSNFASLFLNLGLGEKMVFGAGMTASPDGILQTCENLIWPDITQARDFNHEMMVARDAQNVVHIEDEESIAHYEQEYEKEKNELESKGLRPKEKLEFQSISMRTWYDSITKIPFAIRKKMTDQRREILADYFAKLWKERKEDQKIFLARRREARKNNKKYPSVLPLEVFPCSNCNYDNYDSALVTSLSSADNIINIGPTESDFSSMTTDEKKKHFCSRYFQRPKFTAWEDGRNDVNPKHYATHYALPQEGFFMGYSDQVSDFVNFVHKEKNRIGNHCKNIADKKLLVEIGRVPQSRLAAVISYLNDRIGKKVEETKTEDVEGYDVVELTTEGEGEKIFSISYFIPEKLNYLQPECMSESFYYHLYFVKNPTKVELDYEGTLIMTMDGFQNHIWHLDYGLLYLTWDHLFCFSTMEKRFERTQEILYDYEFHFPNENLDGQERLALSKKVQSANEEALFKSDLDWQLDQALRQSVLINIDQLAPTLTEEEVNMIRLDGKIDFSRVM